MILNKKNIHFIGIGGIGMSAIARVLLEMGYKVTGSDLELNDLTRAIESMGGKVFKGHTASNLPKDTEVVVYSSSINDENPEIVQAKKYAIQIVHRAEALAELLNNKKGIAITGTHGKTTTTSLISSMLENAGLDPTVVIGGEVDLFNGNAKFGRGEYLVAEADESDSSFLSFKPFYAVVTNIEAEHMDHFRDIAHIKSSFSSFINNVKKDGVVFYNHDDAITEEVMKGYRGNSKTFGLTKRSDIYADDIRMGGFNSSFTCVYNGKTLGRVDLKIPGRHNVLNALASILVGLTIKALSFKKITKAIKNFRGTKRRFHLRADVGGIMLIDDYAHHPTEVRAVLDACAGWKNKRIIAVFQPHRYTRTKFLANDFGKCFAGADKLILTDIYAASEEPIEGVSVHNIYNRVRACGLEDAIILKKEEIPDYIMKIKKRGDMILVMGAGNIKKVADELAEKLNQTSRSDRHLFSQFKKAVKGNVRMAERLSRHTSFKIGGPADIWVEPRDAKSLKRTLQFAREHRMPLFVIGNGSNLLVNDNGFKGIVVRLRNRAFRRLKINGTTVNVGAGFGLWNLVKLCCDKGLAGLESLMGIPGSIGGAIYMNAGGSSNPMYKNMSHVVKSLKVMDYSGKVKVLKGGKLKFGYRSSNLSRYIILEAVLKLKKGDRDVLVSSLSKFMKMKKEKQVLDIPSAGCIFKNPKYSQFSCGQMIDMLGLKRARVGGAEVSEKHANFVVNRGGATCKDVLALAELIRRKVKENYNIPLKLEIKVI